MPSRKTDDQPEAFDQLVIYRLDRIDAFLDNLTRKTDRLNVDLATMKGKGAVWGVLGGSLVAGVISVVFKMVV